MGNHVEWADTVNSIEVLVDTQTQMPEFRVRENDNINTE